MEVHSYRQMTTVLTLLSSDIQPRGGEIHSNWVKKYRKEERNVSH